MLKTKLLLVLSFLFTLQAFSQKTYGVQSSTEVLVHGTSTIHDWTSICEYFRGSLIMTVEGDKVVSMKELEFTIVVEGIKSGKKAMDKNTYKAMESDKFPEIKFSSTSIELEPKGTKYSVTIKGVLSIHGVKKSISMQADLDRRGNNWLLSGKKELHTPDYGVERVSAMMGTIKTGEEVTIDFDVVF